MRVYSPQDGVGVPWLLCWRQQEGCPSAKSKEQPSSIRIEPFLQGDADTLLLHFSIDSSDLSPLKR